MLKILLSVMLFSFSFTSSADSLTKRTGLPPNVRVKINKYIAKSYIQSKIGKEQSEEAKTSGYQQSINSITNVRNAPKEMNTVVRGDIINICFRCR